MKPLLLLSGVVVLLAFWSTATMAQGGQRAYLPIVYNVGGTPTATVTGTLSPTPTNTSTRTFTATPTLTRTPRTTVSPTATEIVNTPSPTPVIVVNGDFEQGPGVGWKEKSSSGLTLVVNESEGDPPLPTYNGEWLAWLGGTHNEHATLSQFISVPSTADDNVLYWYYIDSEQGCEVGGDYINIIVDGVLQDGIALCSGNNTQGYEPGLISIRGSSATITFEVFTNGEALSNFYLDGVRVQTDMP